MNIAKEHKSQITKFGFYGFLKNLKFYDPYLLFYLTIIANLSLLQVGLLYSIREIIIYVFEIPSGVIADRFGKKNELVMCFVFYIISFLIFYFATTYWMFIIAMILFGLGEAFRSGTHKAMIMQYLDVNDLNLPKSQIYGKTRSMSLIGSMIMSLISVVFIIWLPEVRLLFLLSIVPYLADIILVLTYPRYLNERRDSNFNLKKFIHDNLKAIKYSITDKKVRGLLLESSSYQAGFKSIKDYIQPLIIVLTSSVILFKAFNLDENLKIYLGLIYAFIYFISSVASKNAHIFVKKFDHRKMINLMWLMSGLSMLLLSFFLDSLIVIFLVFLAFYIFMNIRRPLMVELVGEATSPSKRASVLSVESQTTSLLVAIFAPILGYIADQSMQRLFIFVSGMMLVIFAYNLLTKKRSVIQQNEL